MPLREGKKKFRALCGRFVRDERVKGIMERETVDHGKG